MKVVLRNPRREVEVPGARRVKDVLKELQIIPETVLVIRGDELVTADAMLDDADTIELRPVMSGGSSSATGSASCGRRRCAPKNSRMAKPRTRRAARCEPVA
jgi:sulfur carrier protein